MTKHPTPRTPVRALALASALACAVLATACGAYTHQPLPAPLPAPRPNLASAALAGTHWRIERIDERPAAALSLEEATMTLEANGNMYGSTGCNNFFGSWQEDAQQQLSLQIGGVTRMACPMDEAPLLRAIGQTARYRMQGKALLLLDAAGRVRSRWRPAA